MAVGYHMIHSSHLSLNTVEALSQSFNLETLATARYFNNTVNNPKPSCTALVTVFLLVSRPLQLEVPRGRIEIGRFSVHLYWEDTFGSRRKSATSCSLINLPLRKAMMLSNSEGNDWVV